MFTKRTRTNITYVLAIVMIALGIGFLVSTAVVWKADPSDKPMPSPAAPAAQDAVVELPVLDLQGNWSGELNEATFNATVTDTFITITFVKDTTSIIYWHGSFAPAQDINTQIVSNVIELDKMVLSGADSKTFDVGMTTLSFEFEAMGSKTKVEMKRV
jgi:hypothetical protein